MLQYTLVQRVNPQDPEAPKKWFASPKTVQRLDLSETCKRATRHTSIAPAEVKAALELLVEVLPEMLGDSNSIDIGLLSRGIYTAMITTVAGLIVGIIGQLGYNFLVARVDKIVARMEYYSSELIELLHAKK